MKIVTSAQIQKIDNLAITKHNIPSLTLMENAGSGLAKIIIASEKKSKKAVIVVGKGNNGGDGLVIARHLIKSNYSVSLILTEDPENLSKDSLKNWKKLKALKFHYIILKAKSDETKIKDIFLKSDFIVDAIFGTGLKNNIKGKYQLLIQLINEANSYVYSVDIPSGLSADTGLILGKSVNATETITFGLPKLGHYICDGPKVCGQIHVINIGFPENLLDVNTNIETNSIENFKSIFKKRNIDSHKGHFGHVLVIAGSEHKIGAGWLTSRAALRSGAGLVTYALPNKAYSKFDLNNAEIMLAPIVDNSTGYFIKNSIRAIELQFDGKDVVALGPGLGTEDETKEFTKILSKKLDKPLVLDADGLNNIADNPSILKNRQALTVLTPHLGEMQRLTSVDKETLYKNKLSISYDFAKTYNVYLVLKGSKTIIATPDGKIFINTTGNPGMSSAGMGDALTGIIASFIGQSIPERKAIQAGVYIHGLAGDLACKIKGERGIITSDLIEKIPEALIQTTDRRP